MRTCRGLHFPFLNVYIPCLEAISVCSLNKPLIFDNVNIMKTWFNLSFVFLFCFVLISTFLLDIANVSKWIIHSECNFFLKMPAAIGRWELLLSFMELGLHWWGPRNWPSKASPWASGSQPRSSQCLVKAQRCGQIDAMWADVFNCSYKQSCLRFIF